MVGQIEYFALAWHPQKGSTYRIKLVNAPWTNWVAVSAADLSEWLRYSMSSRCFWSLMLQ
jgi:hypothetical protein